MSLIMVDIESDGPIPGEYSMVAIGAVVVEEGLKKTFYAQLRPISEKFNSISLHYCGFTREQTLGFEDPKEVMQRFSDWVAENSDGRAIFVSDNNGFDWMFVCWYFWHFLNGNPFGHSSLNLGSLYKGLVRDMSKSFKHLRRTAHSHNALGDALGNAEAMLDMMELLGVY